MKLMMKKTDQLIQTLLVNVREEQKQREEIVDAVSIDLGKSSNRNPSQLSPTMSLPEATVP